MFHAPDVDEVLVIKKTSVCEGTALLVASLRRRAFANAK
jgi:hypothetical protein